MELKVDLPALAGQDIDPAAFQRVWDRVMPGQTEPGPVIPDTAVPAEPAVPPEEVPPQLSPVPECPAEPQCPECPPCPDCPQCPVCPEGPGMEGPAEPPALCLGEASRGDSRRLEELMGLALTGARAGRLLARRASGTCARELSALAQDHRFAFRRLSAAYFLITGTQYAPAITIERKCWENLAQALRSCYHQEACNGFNYQRAADGTTDICLQKLLIRLGEQAYRRAEEVQALLGCLLC